MDIGGDPSAPRMRPKPCPVLYEIGCFGEYAQSNILIRGDAQDALEALRRTPPFADEYVEGVKVAYLDPPFNTGNTNRHYRDRAPRQEWLNMLRRILVQLKNLLTEDGSVWLHLNDAEQHRARVILDEVFGPKSFVATIIWERTNHPRPNANPIAIRHDYIHVYRKSAAFAITPSMREATSVDSVWDLSDVGSTQDAVRENRNLFGSTFATPKPERLLARIIGLTTEPGDVVLDCFAGS